MSRSVPKGTDDLSLDELVSRFMQSCRQVSPRSGRRLSPDTLDYYQMCLNGLRYFADQENWPAPAALTRDHLRDFQHYLASEPHRWAGDGRRATYKPAAASTVHHYLKVAATFLKWCEDEEYLENSAAPRFRLPSQGHHLHLHRYRPAP